MTHVERCLKTVNWADDVVVLKPDGKGWGHEAHGKRTDWVLHLWGEELIEEGLQEQLMLLRRRELSGLRASYSIAIRSYLLGHWVEGSLWGPSPSLRLTRELGRHPPVWWDRTVGQNNPPPICLPGKLRDYSVAELASGIQKVNKLTSHWAEAGNSSGGKAEFCRSNVSSLRLLVHLLGKAGLTGNGFAGFTLAVLAAYANLLAGAKVWEQLKLMGDSALTPRDTR
jgi:hypothetical protein